MLLKAANASPIPSPSEEMAEACLAAEGAATHVADVAILGAGVVGMATAWAFARRGLSVVLLDRDQGPAQGTSYANGAQLSYAYTDALGSAGLLKKLPSLVLGGDPVFQVRRPFDPSFWGWGLRFLRNCSAAQFSANTLKGLKLAAESRAAMHDLLDRHSLDFDHITPGKMHLFYDGEGFAAAQEVMALKRANGARQEALTRTEAERIEPALSSIPDLAGVIHSPEDEVGDPHRFCVALLHILRNDYGASARFGFEVSNLRIEKGLVHLTSNGGEAVVAKHVAICMGIDAAPFMKKLGIRLPIWPMKGYSFTAPLGPSAPRVSITDTARKIVFCRLGDRMRVAGLAELGDWSRSVDPDRLQALIGLARESLPEAADYEAAEAGWAGLRPMSPSSLPVISRPRPEVVLNVGHGMLGWTYAMGAAERAARLICEPSS